MFILHRQLIILKHIGLKLDYYSISAAKVWNANVSPLNINWKIIEINTSHASAVVTEYVYPLSFTPPPRKILIFSLVSVEYHSILLHPDRLFVFHPHESIISRREYGNRCFRDAAIYISCGNLRSARDNRRPHFLGNQVYTVKRRTWQHPMSRRAG